MEMDTDCYKIFELGIFPIQSPLVIWIEIHTWLQKLIKLWDILGKATLCEITTFGLNLCDIA